MPTSSRCPSTGTTRTTVAAEVAPPSVAPLATAGILPGWTALTAATRLAPTAVAPTAAVALVVALVAARAAAARCGAAASR